MNSLQKNNTETQQTKSTVPVLLEEQQSTCLIMSKISHHSEQTLQFDMQTQMAETL